MMRKGPVKKSLVTHVSRAGLATIFNFPTRDNAITRQRHPQLRKNVCFSKSKWNVVTIFIGNTTRKHLFALKGYQIVAIQ